MRSLSISFPVIISGFIAVLVGYASSAAIVWQAAAAAGATPAQIASWLTMLGLGMGASTLVLTLKYKAPLLTAWSTPGAALLATSLPGHTPAEAVGVFIFAAALIIICGASGLFARIMVIIPHSLAAAMLAGILLRFGLGAFSGLNDHLLLVVVMFGAWLLTRNRLPRYAVIASLVAGLACSLVQGEFHWQLNGAIFAPPQLTLPVFSLSALLGIGVPFFMVTMASQNAPGVATLAASGYRVPTSPLMVITGVFTLLLAPFGVFSVCIAAITAAICQSPDAHPDAGKRWQAAAWAGMFYLLAGICGGAIGALLSALPGAWLATLAGLALLGTISGSLHQALVHERERDAAIVTFLLTASGVNLLGVGSAFWGLIGGGIAYGVLTLTRRP